VGFADWNAPALGGIIDQQGDGLPSASLGVVVSSRWQPAHLLLSLSATVFASSPQVASCIPCAPAAGCRSLYQSTAGRSPRGETTIICGVLPTPTGAKWISTYRIASARMLSYSMSFQKLPTFPSLHWRSPYL